MGRLFGSSGVRGLANVDVTPLLACKLGLAVATYTKARKALVARDTRVSGPMLEEALVSGLMAAGTDVFMVGVVPTPALAYLAKATKADVGFMITASHNPPEYNGIKIFNGDSLSYTDEGQDAVEKLIVSQKFTVADWRGMGECSVAHLSHTYIEMITRCSFNA